MDDGKTGTLNQCLGLTAALDVTPDIYRVTLDGLTSWIPSLPESLSLPLAKNLSKVHPALPEPLSADVTPDLIITAGRRSAPYAVWARQYLAPQTTLIALQKPPLPLSAFDWVIAPEHDAISGPNVIQTMGALNNMTETALQTQARPFAAQMDALPRPLTAALIGGTAKGVEMSPRYADFLGQKLAHMVTGSLLLSTSRRTPAPAAEALKIRLSGLPGIQYYGLGENPYAAIMAHADSIVVTSDSMSMLSEACTAGKPVYIAELPSKRRKFQNFAASLYEKGLARPFVDSVAPFDTPGLAEANRVAALLKERLS